MAQGRGSALVQTLRHLPVCIVRFDRDGNFDDAGGRPERGGCRAGKPAAAGCSLSPTVGRGTLGLAPAGLERPVSCAPTQPDLRPADGPALLCRGGFDLELGRARALPGSIVDRRLLWSLSGVGPL